MSLVTSSIVVCTRNRLDDIIRFFDSVAVQTVLPNELIVVDSSDTPLNEHPHFISKFNNAVFKNSVLKYEHAKPGLTYQRNIGVKLSQSDIIYFFDDDVVLNPGYIQEMNQVFESYPRYGGGMGSVTNITPKQNNIYRVLRVCFFLQRDYASGFFTVSGMPTHCYGLKNFKDVEVLGGCCMAYRSSVFKNHRFDENLCRYAYMEDCDFSRRISYEVPLFFNPQAQLQHYPSLLNRDAIIDNKAMYMRNYRYLFFKNIYSRNRLKIIAHWWSILGLFVEALIARKGSYIKGYWQGLRKGL